MSVISSTGTPASSASKARSVTSGPARLAKTAPIALSTLSSALKTTSVERSYPTLRGHPPALELGDALDVLGSGWFRLPLAAWVFCFFYFFFNFFFFASHNYKRFRLK